MYTAGLSLHIITYRVTTEVFFVVFYFFGYFDSLRIRFFHDIYFFFQVDLGHVSAETSTPRVTTRQPNNCFCPMGIAVCYKQDAQQLTKI